ncbi:uncharacterized protein LOC130934720 [Arachis stenosperma]|uniref:uncharacterized protein LOC130934720 n=1 Tax=Arachis stenosperma TaxID=217475 RepID=UPI0025AB967E|nr:uncharacterized protein LOC130934720 [Arachis stenosperma]
MAEFQQYIDKSHHDLVNLLTHQMTNILNPILTDNESKYDQLVIQVERIVRIVDYDEGQPIPQDLVVNQENEENVVNNLEREENISYLVRRDQNADEVLNRLHTQCGYHYQVIRIVEDALNRMGINMGLMYRSYFVFSFPAVVQMTEVLMGVINLKIITKFIREAGESTVKHIARYIVELENLANNKNLRMKFFPASLTKNVFNSFSNLRPNSVLTWAQLKNAFHAQFYRTKLNVSLTDLLAIK